MDFFLNFSSYWPQSAIIQVSSRFQNTCELNLDVKTVELRVWAELETVKCRVWGELEGKKHELKFSFNRKLVKGSVRNGFEMVQTVAYEESMKLFDTCFCSTNEVVSLNVLR